MKLTTFIHAPHFTRVRFKPISQPSSTLNYSQSPIEVSLRHIIILHHCIHLESKSMAIIRYKRTTDDNSCYKIGKMILTSLNAKSIFIFSTLAGVVLATNNLRELRTHHKDDGLDQTISPPSYQ